MAGGEADHSTQKDTSYRTQTLSQAVAVTGLFRAIVSTISISHLVFFTDLQTRANLCYGNQICHEYRTDRVPRPSVVSIHCIYLHNLATQTVELDFRLRLGGWAPARLVCIAASEGQPIHAASSRELRQRTVKPVRVVSLGEAPLRVDQIAVGRADATQFGGEWPA